MNPRAPLAGRQKRERGHRALEPANDFSLNEAIHDRFEKLFFPSAEVEGVHIRGGEGLADAHAREPRAEVHVL